MKKHFFSKIVSIVLTLTMVIPLLPLSALAASSVVATVDGKEYYSIDSAWAAAPSGWVLQLQQDWNTISYGRLVVPAGKTVIVDLNNHDIDRGLPGKDDYSNKGEAFVMEANSTLTIRNGYVRNGHTSWYGGAIYMDTGCTVNLDNATLYQNKATTSGGSGGYGGAIYMAGEKCVLNMKNSAIFDSRAYQNGGGIFIEGSNCKIRMDSESRISSNEAMGYGGGIYVNAPYATIEGGSIHYNEARGGSGGGIYGNYHDMIVSDVKITSNHTLAGYHGGGVYINGKNSTLSGCAINNNKAEEGNSTGGGVYVYAPGTTISNCEIKENTAWKIGGGVYVDAHYNLRLNGTVTITDNKRRKEGSSLDVKGNLYLDSDYSSDEYKRSQIVGVPAPNSKIGVMANEGDRIPVSLETGTFNPNNYFCDNDGYYVSWTIEDRYLRIKSGTKPTIPVTDIADPQPMWNGDMSVQINGKEKKYPTYKGYTSFPSSTDPGKDISARFFYSDGYFATPASEYNPQLATMSANLALSAFGSSAGGTEDYTNKFKNVKQLLADAKFSYKNFYVNDAFTKKPTDNSIGVAISNKEITADKTYTLVPVVIRGGGYESEWVSNVTLGSGTGEAKGFSASADQVMAAVEQYITNYKLTSAAKNGEIKFWVTGFSRAGATANLVAKRLIDKYGDKNQVYAYTIEAPQGGIDNPALGGDGGNYEKYAGIHNVINAADPVPMVGPKEMGFKRYGVDHYVPGSDAGSVRSVSSTTNNGQSVTSFRDNEPLSTKAYGYIDKRNELVRQLGFISDTFVFDDYFHLSTVNYVDFAMGLCDLFTESGSSNVTAADFWPLFWSNLQKWALTNNSTDYRKFYSQTTVQNHVTGNSVQTVEGALQHAVKLVFSKSSADVKNIMASLSGVMGKIEKFGLWKNVVKGYNTLSQSDKAYYIEHLWDVLMVSDAGTPCVGDYLTADEEAMLKEDWPVLADTLFRFLTSDYQVRGNAISPAFDTSDWQMLVGTFGYNSSRLLLPHNQETALGWLRAYDSKYASETSGYRIAEQSQPVAPGTNLEHNALYKGDQTLVLSLENLIKGDAIYYSLNGAPYQLYQRPLTLKAPTDKEVQRASYTIKAYAMAYGKKSDEINISCSISANYSKLTVYSDGVTGITTEHLADESVDIRASTVDGQIFDHWEVTNNPGHATIWKPNEPNTWFTMPGLQEGQEMVVKAIFAKYPTSLTVTVQAPQGGADLPISGTIHSDVDAAEQDLALRWTAINPQGNAEDAYGKAGFNQNYKVILNPTVAVAGKILTGADLFGITATINGAEAICTRNPLDNSLIITGSFTTPKAKLTKAPTNPADIAVYTGTEAAALPLPKTIAVEAESGTHHVAVTWACAGGYTPEVAGAYAFTGTLDLATPKLDKGSFSDTITAKVTVNNKLVAAAPTVTSGNPSHSEAAQTIKLATATVGATIRYTLTDENSTTVEADYPADGIVLAAPAEGTTRDYTIKTYTKTTDATSMDNSSSVTYSYTITTPLPNYTVTVNFLDTGLSVGTVRDPITYTYPKGVPFTITAPDAACEVFDHWKLTNNVKDPNRTLTYASGITGNVELDAVYAPVISKIEFEITPPVAGNPLAIDSTDLVSCKVTVQSEYNITNLLDFIWFTADETAAYNTAYTAAIIMKNMEDLSGIPGIPPDLKFYFADNVTLTANGGAVCELYQDSSGPAMYVEFPKTAKPMLLGITPPNSISLTNGADLTLPATVGILTEDESVTSTSVTWGATGYQKDLLTSQRLTIAGTITVPEDVDGTFISHEVTQYIFVAGAPYAKAPIASLASGEYDSGRTVMLVTETEGAEVYYTTDGTMPTTASAKYAKPITIDKNLTISAISVKNGMQNSAASVFTYTLHVPSEDNDIGYDGSGNTDFISIGSVKVNATLSGKTATLSLTDTQVKQILTGVGTDGIVRVDLSALKADTLVLPVNLLDAVRASATAHTVELPYQTGSVTLDKTVLASLTGGEVKVSLKAQAGSSLTDEQKQPLGKLAEEALVLEVSISVGGTKKTEFNGGKLLVRAPYKLPLNRTEESVAVWHIAADGSLSPMDSAYKDKEATFTTAHLSRFAVVAFPFKDVAQNAWYYGDVAYTYAHDLFGGTGDTTFSPEMPMSRGMLVTVLWRLEGEPQAGTSAFSDIVSDAYYAEAVSWAAANKIVSGFDGKFAPNDPMNREQFATILHRYAKYKGMDVSVGEDTNILSYDDAFTISQYAIPAMQWACGAGIMQGSGSKLMPQGGATRAQTAAVLQRFMMNTAK